jgi:protein PhnA
LTRLRRREDKARRKSAAKPRPAKERAMPEDIVRDAHGNELKDGDSVTLIKDLKVKGTSETIKRGTLVKNIRLTGDPDEVECNTKQVKGLVLRTEFLKKA